MFAVPLILLAMGFAEVESGPKKDADVPALKVQFVTGTHDGKEIDVPADRKGEVTVYLFITSDKFSRPVGRFMKELDGKVGEASDKCKVIAVWTGGDADKNKEYIPKVNGSLKFEKTDLGYSTNATPEGWALNSDASLTVVVTKDKKVVRTFAYASANEKDVPKVIEEVKVKK